MKFKLPPIKQQTKTLNLTKYVKPKVLGRPKLSMEELEARLLARMQANVNKLEEARQRVNEYQARYRAIKRKVLQAAQPVQTTTQHTIPTQTTQTTLPIPKPKLGRPPLSMEELRLRQEQRIKLETPYEKEAKRKKRNEYLRMRYQLKKQGEKTLQQKIDLLKEKNISTEGLPQGMIEEFYRDIFEQQD